MQETQPQKPKSRKKLWIILGIIGGTIILLFLGFMALVIIVNRTGNSGSGYGGSYGMTSSTSPMSLEKSSSSPSESLTQDREGTQNRAKEVPQTAAGTSSDNSSSGESGLTEQKVIKTGSLSLVVEKVGEAVSKLNNLAVSKKGFVLSSSVYTNADETQSATVTLKVPFQKYEEAMNEIKKVAKVVQSESSSGQDVTEQYSDLQAQSKNYKAEEEQYLEILKKAVTVEDILKVTEKLSLVRGNIEVTVGRIKYLENQTDMSTITVSLGEETRIDVPTKEWKPITTLKKAFRSWIQSLQGLVDVLIWLVIFLGPVLVLILLIIKIVKWKRKKKIAGSQ